MNVLPPAGYESNRQQRLQRSRGSLLRVLFTLLLVASGFGLLAGPVRAAAPTEFYVEDTGHTLGGEFLQWWIENDGATTLGNPVTEPISRASDLTQYFEYGVLSGSATGDVTRLAAARDLLHLDNQSDAEIREIAAAPNSTLLLPIKPIRDLSALGSGYIYHVDAQIRPYYETNGGRTIFGRPVTGIERSGDQTGQWFEFARLDISGTRVERAQVGFELAEARNIDTSRILRGDLPLFNPNRYVRFVGDGTIPNAEGAFIPSRIMIPAIEVDAQIEPVSVLNGVMQVPVDEWNVGWYPSMSSPGEWSNVVMAGHKDWWGVGPVVFWSLDTLAPGDKIYVLGPDGAGATYEVTLTWLIGSTMPADPLIADTGYEALTLITCSGQWNGYEYTSRRIVRAKRI